MNKNVYNKMIQEHSPKSPILTDVLKAFLGGGAICVFGELLRNLFLYIGFDTLISSTYTSITLIIITQFLSGPGYYEKAAKHLGAGLSVPISGFANAVVSPAIEYHSEGLILGIGAKLFTISGPVIVYGTAASVIAGFIYWSFNIIKEVLM